MTRTTLYTLILTILALAAFGVVLYRAFYFYPSDEVPLPQEALNKIADQRAKNEQLPTVLETPGSVVASAPTMRLLIPSIDVDAKVVDVGVTKSGNMASPRNFSDVGWYKYGTLPGKTGSSVMAGHVNNGIALPAVFSDLEDLKEGDDIFVVTKEGKRLHFVVTGKKTYPYDSAPEEVFNDDSGRYLKLITCVGTVIRELRTHSQRLVVSAKLVE